MPGVGECYRALYGAYLGLSKLTNFFALALTSLFAIEFQLLTDAEPRPRGVSGENAHYGCTGADHHFRKFNDTNLSLALRVGLYKNHFFTSLRWKVMTCRTLSRLPHSMVLTRSAEGGRFLTALSLQSHGTLVLTRSTEGFSAPSASLYKALSTLPVCYQTFIRTESSRLLSLGGFSYSYIAYLLYSSKLLRLFGVRVSAQSALVEQDTGFEPALPVWKTGVLAADTNPA